MRKKNEGEADTRKKRKGHSAVRSFLPKVRTAK